ncbi:unnamed protein product [Rhizopus stolonifer]
MYDPTFMEKIARCCPNVEELAARASTARLIDFAKTINTLPELKELNITTEWDMDESYKDTFIEAQELNLTSITPLSNVKMLDGSTSYDR